MTGCPQPGAPIDPGVDRAAKWFDHWRSGVNSMSISQDAVAAITFDSFTTLVDVQTSTRRVLGDYVDNPAEIAATWRSRAVDYRMVSTFTGVYESYEETTRSALEYALAVHGADLPAADIEEIAAVFRTLDVYPDVRPGMEQLAAAGYELYVLSNGTPELLETIVERTAIGDLIEGTISADRIESYKPDPAIYEHAAERIDASIDEIVHVTAPWYDVYGAMHAGMQPIWMNRNGDPWDRFNGEPDVVVRGFEELLAEFGV